MADAAIEVGVEPGAKFCEECTAPLALLRRPGSRFSAARLGAFVYANSCILTVVSADTHTAFAGATPLEGMPQEEDSWTSGSQCSSSPS
jgi:hypothetical protein